VISLTDTAVNTSAGEKHARTTEERPACSPRDERAAVHNAPAVILECTNQVHSFKSASLRVPRWPLSKLHSWRLDGKVDGLFPLNVPIRQQAGCHSLSLAASGIVYGLYMRSGCFLAIAILAFCNQGTEVTIFGVGRSHFLKDLYPNIMITWFGLCVWHR